MANGYEVLLDTLIGGHYRLAGSVVDLSEEDASGYIRAGLIKGDAVEGEPAKPVKKVQKE